jgi:predicted ATP-grasp superfamily ATP-dependent carboligase
MAARANLATMDYLEELKTIDQLRDPVLLTGFMMQRRAGRLGARTVGYLVEHWHAEPIARIDMTSFVNLAMRRPNVRRTETEASIEWPETTIYLARSNDGKRDICLLPSLEPELRWKTFADTIARYLDGLGVKTMVSLRARPGEVPHTRPAPVYVSATDIDLELLFGVQSTRPRNEGPSSIAGVLAARVEAMRWKTAELAVVQPDYFPRMPNAEGMLALIRLIDKAFGMETPVEGLTESAAEQRELLDRGTAGDDETRWAIQERERAYDRSLERLDFLSPNSDGAEGLPSGDIILQEVERLFGKGDPDD